MLFSECSQMPLEMLQNLFYVKTHTFSFQTLLYCTSIFTKKGAIAIW